MYVTYAGFSRLFCPAIKKSIKNKNPGNLETTKKIKKLMRVSKFFKIFTTSGDGVLSFLSGAGIAVILTGSLLLELFAFGIALKVALVASSALLCVFLASGVVGFVSLVTSCIKKAVKEKEIKTILENYRKKISPFINVQSGDVIDKEENISEKIEGLVLKSIEEILENKNRNDRNKAVGIIIEENIEYAKGIYRGYTEKSKRSAEVETWVFRYIEVILKLEPGDHKEFYEKVFKDISISDEVYEKVLKFYFEELLSSCCNEEEKQFRKENEKIFREDFMKIFEKISDEKKKEELKKKFSEEDEGEIESDGEDGGESIYSDSDEEE